MTTPRQMRPPSAKKTQLRGRELDDRIEVVIRDLAELAHRSGRPYIFNASEVARAVPTTRKSIAKHEATVGQILAELDARRRLVSGEATVEHFREQIAHLRDEIAQRDKTILALRSQHVEIFMRFYGASLEGEMLLRPIIEQESDDAGHCLLCGASVGTDRPQAEGRTAIRSLRIRR
jgi:chromosome segregation ATPase